jgi:hypothetical protein
MTAFVLLVDADNYNGKGNSRFPGGMTDKKGKGNCKDNCNADASMRPGAALI